MEFEQEQGDSRLTDVLVARQPILKRDRQVFGFDLLYESEESAAELLANLFLSVGVRKVAGSKPLFVKMDRRMFTTDYANCLPNRPLVLEIPASMEATSDALEVCRLIKLLGHSIALRDPQEPARQWLSVVDYLRVDFRRDSAREALHSHRHGRIQVIADRVDTEAEFLMAAEQGFDYFKGAFFAHPTLVSGRALRETRVSQMRILREVAKEEIDLKKVEQLIQQDVSLTYKLLRYINSASFGWRSKIKSVRHAISLIGDGELRKWTCLVMVMMMGGAKASPLFVKSLVRARFGELLAARTGLERAASSMFLLGLLSHLDGILQVPMDEVLSDLDLDDRIKETLLKAGTGKGPMQFLFALIESYDAGDWVRSMALLRHLGLSHHVATESYLQAVDWAELVAGTN